MTLLLAIIVLFVLFGILIPKTPADTSISYGISVKLPYLFCVMMMIISPVISVLIQVEFNEGNKNLVFLQHLWVGIALSLPLSVVVARSFGDTNSTLYWQYLESLGGHSKRVIIYSWGFAAAVAFLGAVAIAFTT